MDTMTKIITVAIIASLLIGIYLGRYSKDRDSQQVIDGLVKVITVANGGCK